MHMPVHSRNLVSPMHREKGTRTKYKLNNWPLKNRQYEKVFTVSIITNHRMKQATQRSYAILKPLDR
jgi:hypothetical protein